MGDADDRSTGADEITDASGVVKWFNARKGFGFLVGPDGQDIFAHFSAVKADGYRTLEDGERVRYSAVQTEKGWKATHISREMDIKVTIPPRRARASNA